MVRGSPDLATASGNAADEQLDDVCNADKVVGWIMRPTVLVSRTHVPLPNYWAARPLTNFEVSIRLAPLPHVSRHFPHDVAAIYV